MNRIPLTPHQLIEAEFNCIQSERQYQESLYQKWETARKSLFYNSNLNYLEYAASKEQINQMYRMSGGK
jgi:hypothetical protein